MENNKGNHLTIVKTSDDAEIEPRRHGLCLSRDFYYYHTWAGVIQGHVSFLFSEAIGQIISKE